MKDTLCAIKERSSTRAYTGEPLTKEELDAIIAAGLQAPTAGNSQEIHFTVVDSKAPVLAEIVTDMLKERPDAPADYIFYYGAPTVILLTGKEDFFWSTIDAGIAVENMALAAEALGLGSVILGCIKETMRGEKKVYYSEALGIPEAYEFEVAIAIGHKAMEKEPHEFASEERVNYIG